MILSDSVAGRSRFADYRVPVSPPFGDPNPEPRTDVTRFRLNVEALDARTLPSAMFAMSADPTSEMVQSAQFADESGSLATGEAVDQDSSVAENKKPPSKPAPKPDTYLKITMTDVLVSSYN